MKDADLIKQERQKYRAMYRSGMYDPRRSVGAKVCPIAWGWAAGLGAVDLIDWGCGHGRATRWFRDRGLDAWGLDLVETGDTKNDGRCRFAPMWKPAPDLPVVDFAFSADVLEHLPEQRVGASLEQIAYHTRIGGWLQIATIPDKCGAAIGETLHLTVRPPEWWAEKVGEVFDVVATETTEREVRLWLRV